MYFFVFVAAGVAFYFVVTAFRRPRLGVIAAALVWVLYAVYEYLIANGTLCDANCNIRVDLLLIWPLVWTASLFGLYAPGQWTRAGKIVAGLSLIFLAAVAAISLYITLVETPAAERAAQPAAATTNSAAGAK